MQKEKKKLGHILIKKGILTPYTVARMLRESKYRNKRLGCVLEEFGLVTSEELAAVLAQQFNLRHISNLASNTYPPDVLQVVSAEFALEQIVFPLRMEGRMLHLAIADPTDTKIIDNFAKNNGLCITPYVASRKEIHAAITRHYLGTSVKGAEKTTILVVEDEDLLLSEMKGMLVRQGYHVVTASDGMKGFKEVIASRPRVIVTDSVMPKLDGFALLKSLKSTPETCAIPVILVSDKLSDEDEAKVFETGFFDYIPKPFREVTFVSRINRAVSSGELAVVFQMATNSPCEKREAAGRLDDDFLFRPGEGRLADTDTHPSVRPGDEPHRPVAVIGREMLDLPGSEPSLPVTAAALSETAPSVAEHTSGPDTAPASLEIIRSTFPSPADFIIAAPVSADPEAQEMPFPSQAVARRKMDGVPVSGESNRNAGHESDARLESLPAHSHALPVTGPPAMGEAPPQMGDDVRISQSMPAAMPSGRNFAAFDGTTVHTEKIIEDTLLAYNQGRRLHSRRIIYMVAVVLVVISGGGYALMGQLDLRSLCRADSPQRKTSGQTSAQAGEMKESELSRPVRMLLPDVPKTAVASVQQLPTFIPVNGRNASFSTQRPGWERYVDTRRDVRVFRQNGRVKALQVIAAPGQVFTEAFVRSALRELTGNGDFASTLWERRGNYLLQRSRVGRHADVLVYRKAPVEAIVAFVVSLD